MLQVCSHTAYHYQGAALTQSIHTLTHAQSAFVSDCNTHIGASNGSANNKPTHAHIPHSLLCSFALLLSSWCIPPNMFSSDVGSKLLIHVLFLHQTVTSAWSAPPDQVIIMSEIMSHGGRKTFNRLCSIVATSGKRSSRNIKGKIKERKLTESTFLDVATT